MNEKAFYDRLMGVIKSIDDVVLKAEQNKQMVIRNGEAGIGTNALGVKVIYTPEQIEANRIAALKEAGMIDINREAEIDKLVTNGEAIMREYEKAAAQYMAKAIPYPTAEDEARIKEILKQHENMNFEDKNQIEKELRFHAENETEWAPAYFFVMRDLACSLPADELAQIGEQVFPGHIEARAKMDACMNDRDMWESAVLISEYNRKGGQMSFTERIAIKNRLAERGYIDMIDQYKYY